MKKTYNYFKRLFVALGILFCFQLGTLAQTVQKLESKIQSVTVFKEGAQITREASFSLTAGQTLIQLVKLSPFISKESIRIEGDGNYTILNVQLQRDYLQELDKSAEIDALNAGILKLYQGIEDEELLVKIAKDKLEFLNANKQITGGQQSISPDAFRTLTEIYSSKLEVLNLEILKRQRLISTYNQDLIRLKNQLNSIQSKSTQASSTIFVTISAKNAKKAKINFSFTTDKASWTPTYDIRFEGNDKPLSISYKANISQTTGVDWRGVNISLSTAKTDMSAQIPTLEPLYVRWKPTDISSVLQGRVAGVQIQQESAAPGAGSEVRIRGLASVGDAQNPLYIVDGVVMSDVSDLDKDAIDRVEVLKDASATAIYGSRASNGVVLITTKKNKGTMNRPLTISSKTETAMEFMVDALQTIESNNKSTTVTYRETTLPASFEYQSVPKLSENVFLIGSIKDWYKQDLLSAEVNVYLGNSFIGKSTLNTEQFTDTLQVSFGADNNISIKRERVVEFSENQFIGSSRKQTIAHRITIRNNKAYAITSKITDQIPISRDKEIEVSPLELSGAILESENGKLTWEVALQSNETKEMLIKYTVKSPKNRSVVLE